MAQLLISGANEILKTLFTTRDLLRYYYFINICTIDGSEVYIFQFQCQN